MFSATVADGQTAASCEKGRKTEKINLSPLLDGSLIAPFRSHRGLLDRYSGHVLEDQHRLLRGFLQKDASMRALLVDRQNCSLFVSKT